MRSYGVDPSDGTYTIDSDGFIKRLDAGEYVDVD